MRLKFLLLVFVVAAMTATGCGAFQVEAGFKQPAELTATAEAGSARPTPPPKPPLGKLAFVRGGDIWVKELPDGEARRLTQDGNNSEPRWSPSGEWIAFQKKPQLWVMRASPDTFPGSDRIVPRTGSRQVGRAGGTDARQVETGPIDHFAWSPVADKLAYTYAGGLLVVNGDGSDRRQLVPVLMKSGGAGVGEISWSPDGQSVAFEKSEVGPSNLVTYQGLWTIRADGANAREIYSNDDPLQTQSKLAGWSSDGRQILFWEGLFSSSSLAADGLPLLQVAVDGGQPEQVAKFVLPHRDFLASSPDGQSLAFVDGGNRASWDTKRIAIADESGTLQVLSEQGRADLFPEWSPDGQQIAFSGGPEAHGIGGGEEAKKAMDARRIWVMNADGSGKRQLTNDADCRDERPSWSADGSRVLFVRMTGDQAQLWLMNADGSGPRPVVDELTPRPDWFGYYGYTDWSQLFDWWKGMPRAVQQPASISGPTTTPSPAASAATPARDLDAFLRAAVSFLERPDARQLPEADVALRLRDLAPENGVEISYRRSQIEETSIQHSKAKIIWLAYQGANGTTQ